MIIVSEYPSKTISTSVLKSRYHAAFNPIIYKLQRKDIVVVSVKKATIEMYTKTTSGLIPLYDVYVTISAPLTGDDSIAVGDFVYLKSGGYDVIAEVVEIVTTIKFRLSTAYLGDSVGGFMNLNTSRVGYYLETEVLVEQNGTYVIAGKIRSVPDTKGVIEFDASEWVQTYVSLQNIYLYDGSPNKAERTSSGIFNLRYTESWQNNEEVASSAIITDSTYQFYMGSVRQVLDTYGQNMAEFVPYAPAITYAKFLTENEEPTYFVGYPFDVSFIFSDIMAAYETSRRVREYDGNGVITQSQADTTLDIAHRFYTNRLSIEEPQGDTEVVEVELIIDTTITSEERATPDGYVATGYWEERNAGDVIVSPPLEF